MSMSSTASTLAERLRTLGWHLATAESCTGGMIAAACTDLAGSSDWFDRGFVTYSNVAKSEMLGVESALIARDGAVSESVARAMATGAQREAEVAAVGGDAGRNAGLDRGHLHTPEGFQRSVGERCTPSAQDGV